MLAGILEISFRRSAVARSRGLFSRQSFALAQKPLGAEQPHNQKKLIGMSHKSLVTRSE